MLSTHNSWLEHVGAILMEIHPNTTDREIGGFLTPFGFSLRRHCFGAEPVYLATRERTAS